MTAAFITLLVAAGGLLGYAIASRRWKQRVEQANNAERAAAEVTARLEDAEWDRAYEMGLIIGRAGKPKQLHRIVIVDPETWHRIASMPAGSVLKESC